MESDDCYLGAMPPVEVKATNCHTVNVNVQVLVESRPPDTLRRMAEMIEERINARIIKQNG